MTDSNGLFPGCDGDSRGGCAVGAPPARGWPHRGELHAPAYLAGKGVSLRPDDIGHHVTEVHPIWELIRLRVVKLGVVVELGQQLFICRSLKQKGRI